MEPVFLEMGQSCGLAAAFARKGAVQDVDVTRIQEVLVNDPYMDGNGPDSPIDSLIKRSNRPSCINPALRK